MAPIRENYCRDCDWSADIEDHNRQELATLAIEHAVETGHDIDSTPTKEKSVQPTKNHLSADTETADSTVD